MTFIAGLQARRADLERELQNLPTDGAWEQERARIIRLELSHIAAELSGWELERDDAVNGRR